MRAILIDPFKCEVTEIDYDNSNFENLYPLLSHESMPVDCFTVIDYGEGETLYVDDEGLLKNPERGFLLGNSQPLAGKGVMLGSDEDGNSIATKIPLEDIKDRVLFFEFTPRGLLATIVPWVDNSGQLRQS
jgi:hypothetical protein